jgi:hypothetical protein
MERARFVRELASGELTMSAPSEPATSAAARMDSEACSPSAGLVALGTEMAAWRKLGPEPGGSQTVEPGTSKGSNNG